MLAEYFEWQFIVGPAWLVHFIWNLQRALFRLFSVWIMIRTLLAPWRRDVVEYNNSPFGSVLMTLSWNQISRVMGLTIRLSLLVIWMMCALALLVLGALLLCAFVLWPLLSVVGIMAGTALLFA